MKKLTLITIGLSLLLIFAACSDSNNILSPAEDLTVEPVGEETVLAKAMADPVGSPQKPASKSARHLDTSCYRSGGGGFSMGLQPLVERLTQIRAR